MHNVTYSIDIDATKERVWEVLWSDESFRDWSSIIDPGTYMDGILEEGGEIYFISSHGGYGVAGVVEKLTPLEYVAFNWTADIRVSADGAIEKREPQWTGGKESYELQNIDGKIKLVLKQTIPDELAAEFELKIPKALVRIKILAELKNEQ